MSLINMVSRITTAAAARTIGALAVNGVAESFIDNVLRDKVSEPAIGSMVYCDFFHAEHTGIYIGNGKIVHLDGNGKVKSVGHDSFLDRMDGLNTAISIYVSCNGADPVGCSEAARRARAMLNRRIDYNLLMNNCHQFTAGCLTGEFENGYNFFSLLKPLAEETLDANAWRVWDV
jgi:hypothetical protein